jgi:hypothetical protein
LRVEGIEKSLSRFDLCQQGRVFLFGLSKLRRCERPLSLSQCVLCAYNFRAGLL